MLKISGCSRKDRVSFYTSRTGVTAIRKKSGEICFFYGRKTVTKEDFFSFLVLFILPAVAKECIVANTRFTLYAHVVITMYYVLMAVAMITYNIITGGTEFLKNHTAEHMVANAYQHLGYVPTVAQATRFSRFHNNCGTNLCTAYIVSQAIGLLVYLLTGWFILPEVLLLVLPHLLYDKFPFSFVGRGLQLLVTAPPEHENLELAIASLRALEERTEQLRQRR